MAELTDHQQGIGPDALAQLDTAPGRADRRGNLDLIAVCDAQLARAISADTTAR